MVLLVCHRLVFRGSKEGFVDLVRALRGCWGLGFVDFVVIRP